MFVGLRLGRLQLRVEECIAQTFFGRRAKGLHSADRFVGNPKPQTSVRFRGLALLAQM